MTCLSDGLLRAKVDDELTETELAEVDSHLASCAGCRRRGEIIGVQAKRVGGALASLAPLPGEAPTEAASAYASFKARLASSREEAPSLWSRLSSRRLRPAWGVAALVALVVLCVSFIPARSWAQKILAMLRVQKIAVVAVDPDIFAGPGEGGRTGKMIEQLLSDNLVVTMDPGKPQAASDLQQASQMAGFRVRLLSSRADQPRLWVEGQGAFHMTLNRERLQAILDEVGRSDLQLPASLDGATVAVHIPKLVVARYGNCPEHGRGDDRGPYPAGAQGRSQGEDLTGCVFLAQVPSPTVSVPPDLNIAEIAEAGLQLAGMPPEQAHAFCQTVDWTSTLVVPLPRDISSYETVEVDGVQGTLIDQPPVGRLRPAGYTLLWVKSGIIYTLDGYGSHADGITLAESLN